MTISKYKAFLSYSHRDKVWAEWLHRRLETYKFPKNMARATPPALKPIFRDREELSVSADLSKRVQEALLQSECLIVICSENAVKSKWVNKEIRLFQTLKPEAEIFPVIVSGEPHAEQQGLPSEIECFPPALRFGPTEDNSAPQREPLAADLRKTKDGKQLGLVKLIAGMTNMRPDELIQRDLQRARKRVTAITSGASVIVLALSLLTVSTIIARKAAEENAVIAQQQRDLAELRRDEAEGLIEFMLGDLRQELEPVGRLSLLTNVADRALEYYSQVGGDLSNCKSASGAARAKYLHTRIAVSQNNFSTARAYSDDALNLLDRMSPECSTIRQFVTNHSHALQWSADLDVMEQQSETDNAITFDPVILQKYQRAKTNLRTFKRDDATTIDMRIEQVDADILIGKYYMSVKRIEDALSQFKMAETALKADYKDHNSAPASPASHAFIIQDKYADILSWISGAYEGLSQLDQATETLQKARRIYASLSDDGKTPGGNWKARFDIIGTDYALSRLLYKQGQKRAALDILQSQKKNIDALVAQDPANQSWRDLQDNITSSISALKNIPPPTNP